MSQATFGGLLTDALAELEATHAVLTAAPRSRTSQPNDVIEQLEDVAAALHTLGRTVGDGGPSTRELSQTLNHDARPFGTRDFSEPGLARAAATIRAAAELLASNGPLHAVDAGRPPRPAHLTDAQARAGAWHAIATLTDQLARVARATATPTGGQLAQAWTRAATAVPHTGMPEAMIVTTPGRAVPLPGIIRGRAFDDRVRDLTAIAHGVAHPASALPPPAGTLQFLTAFATTTYQASALASPAHSTAYQRRAGQWGRIHAALTALRSPTVPAPREQADTTRAVIQLLNKRPSANDLTRARAAVCQIAPWISQSLTHMAAGRTAVAIGDQIPPLIAAATTNLNNARLNHTTVTLRPDDVRRVQVMLSHTARPVAADTNRTITLGALSLSGPAATAGSRRR